MKISLRPYQADLVQFLTNSLRSGNRRVILYLPTGGGKTIVASSLCKGVVSKRKRVLFVVNRQVLVAQTIDKLLRHEVPVGVIRGGHRYQPELPVQVTTVQTLAHRQHLPPADLVIVDECHGSTTPSYDRLFEAYDGKVFAGLSATPWRLSKKESLADRWQDIVGSVQTADLVEMGYLCPARCFGFGTGTIDTEGVRSTGIDFNQKDLAIKCNTPAMVARLVGEYQRYALGRRAIAFAVDIAHARAISQEFCEAGIPAEFVTGDTSASARQEMFARLRSGETKVVSSCSVLSEGFDEPSAEVAILARPTQSKGLCLQQIGRVLRLSPETGKTEAIILDQAGNIHAHGLPTERIELTLEPADSETGDAPTKECPECGAISHISARECPECGYQFEIEESRHEHLRRFTELTPEVVTQIRGYAARSSRAMQAYEKFLKDFPDPTLEQLRAFAAAVGYKQGWAWYSYQRLQRAKIAGGVA